MVALPNKTDILEVKHLEVLCEMLNAYGDAGIDLRDVGIDIADLPKFGGVAPSDIAGAVSWNKHAVIVPGNGKPGRWSHWTAMARTKPGHSDAERKCIRDAYIAVWNAPDLDTLCAALNARRNLEFDHHAIDAALFAADLYGRIPTFGGEKPESRDAVSYDPDRQIVSGGSKLGFIIVPREVE